MSGNDGAPWSGSVPIAAGQPSVVHIPIPGPHHLTVGLRTRDPRFKHKSSSTLFIQDPTGARRLLRLDYGETPGTTTKTYHWNQKSAYARFGIPDHAPVGRGGRFGYHGARAYRWAGGTLVVVGAALDGVSIYQASQRMRRASQVVSAWALAWVGCKAGGYVGGGVGSAVAPGPGTMGGAIGGCIVGGYAGYRVGERVGDVVYQWAEDTVFTRLPEVAAP